MRRITLVTLAGALALLAFSATALAGPPACPPTDDPCAALAARLDELDTDLTTLDADLTATSGEPVSGTVALDPDTTQRLDLTWWGIWALTGLTLVLLIAPAWRRVFRWGTSGGDV